LDDQTGVNGLVDDSLDNLTGMTCLQRTSFHAPR
jgi:hypothetical protein